MFLQALHFPVCLLRGNGRRPTQTPVVLAGFDIGAFGRAGSAVFWQFPMRTALLLLSCSLACWSRSVAPSSSSFLCILGEFCCCCCQRKCSPLSKTLSNNFLLRSFASATEGASSSLTGIQILGLRFLFLVGVVNLIDGVQEARTLRGPPFLLGSGVETVQEDIPKCWQYPRDSSAAELSLLEVFLLGSVVQGFLFLGGCAVRGVHHRLLHSLLLLYQEIVQHQEISFPKLSQEQRQPQCQWWSSGRHCRSHRRLLVPTVAQDAL